MKMRQTRTMKSNKNKSEEVDLEPEEEEQDEQELLEPLMNDLVTVMANQTRLLEAIARNL
jgi:hypothetical protein